MTEWQPLCNLVRKSKEFSNTTSLSKSVSIPRKVLYSHVSDTNPIACIVRAFHHLKTNSVFPIYAAVLLGVHLFKPYLSITCFDPVHCMYEHLITAMQQLYQDLIHWQTGFDKACLLIYGSDQAESCERDIILSYNIRNSSADFDCSSSITGQRLLSAKRQCVCVWWTKPR
jgi:hypothetical protein